MQTLLLVDVSYVLLELLTLTDAQDAAPVPLADECNDVERKAERNAGSAEPSDSSAE